MELIYINAAGGRLTLKQTRPFFLSKLDGTGSARQSINTFKAPDQDGAFYISSTMDMRNITLEGTVIASTVDEAYDQRKRFLRVFTPKQQGTLVYRQRQIACVVEEAGFAASSRERAPKFFVSLLCPSPFFETLEEVREELAMWTPLFQFELEIPESGMEFGARQPSQIITVDNIGDVPCGCQIVFKALGTLGAVSSYKESNSIYAAITACGAPTACSVSATLAEGNVTLSWSGASSGAGNIISSYEIQYSESTDGSTWGGWTALTTVTTTATSGSLSVSPSATRGNYRRFQVRTRGTAGSSYYSTWKATTNSVRKNTLPAAPTSFVAWPIIYEINIITLTWSGAAAGTSAIKQYVIQQSTSADGAVWQTYEILATITTSATSGSYETAASTVAGTYTRYRISVTDTLGAVSAYVVSGTVKKNSPPAALMVTAPKAGGATYNARPRFLIMTGTEPDGQTQQVCVKIGADEWQDSVNNPERFSQSGYLGNGVKTVFRSETDLPTGSITAVFKCVDEGIASSSPEVSCAFTVLAAPFETITEHETKVKAKHIRAIREAVNAARGYYGLAATNWSENIIAGKTFVKNWPRHILEIRVALEGVVDFINQFDTVSTFDIPEVDWLPLGTGRPRAAVMRQIQDLILTL